MNSFLEALTGLRLLDPTFLLLAPLVVAVFFVERRRAAPGIAFAPAGFLGGTKAPTPSDTLTLVEPRLPESMRQRWLPLPGALCALGLLLVLLALARPVQRTPLPETTDGIDILLCLDVSSSMRAQDLDGERVRLDVAKDAAAQFIAARTHDRVGLLCFARYPDVRCPLTLDHQALRQILGEVSMVASDSQEDATGIGAALARAAQVLRQGVAKSKVAIVLTDGEENVATPQTPTEIAPLHAAQLCHELGVRAYTIAVGVGERLPDGAMRALDTTAIQRVARRTGGKFFAAADATTLRAVYAEIDGLERTVLAEPRFRVEERFLPFLLAALAALLLGRFLRATWLSVMP